MIPAPRPQRALPRTLVGLCEEPRANPEPPLSSAAYNKNLEIAIGEGLWWAHKHTQTPVSTPLTSLFPDEATN